MNFQHLIIVSAMVVFVVVLSCAIAMGAMGPLPMFSLRKIAEFYLNNTFNPFNRLLSAMTPEAVTAIVWDFRGLDTYFEVSVFYLAIIATAMLYRGVEVSPRLSIGLNVIVKTVTRIVVPLTLIISIAIALHGHLTPGGGFQAGSTAAVSVAIIIVTFSLYTLLRSGLSKFKLYMLRSLALAGIFFTAILPFVIAMLGGERAFIFQNQIKPFSQFGLPYEIFGIVISGSCSIFNILDGLAVSMGFSLLLILLATPEEFIAEVVEREEGD